MGNEARTIVYVDGFNLYYGAVRNTPFRWLDLVKMAELLLPGHRIVSLKYFTARVSDSADDPGKSLRQAVYLRALNSNPIVSIHFGHFLTHAVLMPLATPQEGQRLVKVRKTEEKGSDVNLATHLLCDAYEDRLDAAVIVSNDSDLVEPLRIVSQRLGKVTGVLNPHKKPSRARLRYASFYKPIRKGVLAASHFPDHMRDTKGSIHKPLPW